MKRNKWILGAMVLLAAVPQTVSAQDRAVMPAQAKQELLPANKDKDIRQTADEFYEELLKKGDSPYREFENAKENVRKKVLFHEVQNYYYRMQDGRNERLYPHDEIVFYPTPHPERQVYFFLSVREDEKEFRGAYAIYDAETKRFLSGGRTFQAKQK
ncbi:hypothetical protein [Ectobacillus ponti]|uniref:Uncharacterized protein n=1 Tax=Ectobacillus ponti TaxID=2961894 RepID=A0AA41X1L7_9BACI|nr:hypothetical protein [Ectobacillus ponti]MCP8966932.1 hypothetical protein [Ectobacillus ponti]